MTRQELEKLFPLKTWVTTFCHPHYRDGVRAKVVDYMTTEDADVDFLLAVEGERPDIPNPYVGRIEDLWEPEYVMSLKEWRAFLTWAGSQINWIKHEQR